MKKRRKKKLKAPPPVPKPDRHPQFDPPRARYEDRGPMKGR